jgi:hypothetical protein
MSEHEIGSGTLCWCGKPDGHPVGSRQQPRDPCPPTVTAPAPCPSCAALREALRGLRRGGLDPEALDCWCDPWWDDRPASGPPRYIHRDACKAARRALAAGADGEG